jgi:nucleoside 2-deoxyribosyltransferase-like protein
MPWLVNPSSQTRLYVGSSLREGPKPLFELSRFFHTSGYTVYLPYDDDNQNSPADIKKWDMDALKSCDVAILKLEENSLGVAQELGAARALNKPVILITTSERVIGHNWVRGDSGIKCCPSREEALQLVTVQRLQLI